MSFPAYPSYQGSGVEWIGEVPSHWSLPKIKHLATFAGGSTPSRDDPSLWNGDIPWVSPKDMKFETITGSEEQITERGLSQMAGGLIDPGAVLLVVRSGILRHTIPVAITSTPVALNQDMKALRFDLSQCEPRFFFRWVQGLNDSLILAWMKQGATVESLEHQFLAETTLPLPPMAEQVAIAAFLDRETAKIDALIEEQRRLIALLKEKRQAVISHAVTKGLDPHAPMKDSGIEWLGEVPDHWTVSKLRHLTRQIVDGAHFTPTYVDEGVPFLRVTDITRRRIDLDEVKRIPVEEHDELVRRCNPQIGDLLLSKNGTIGVPMVIDWGWDFSIFVSLCLIKFNERMDANFAKGVFLSKAIEVQIAADAKQSTVTNLHLEKIAGFAFPVPPIDEQRAISSFIQNTIKEHDGLIMVAEEAIDLLLERRAALIAAAVTGKIDVRGSATVLSFPVDRARARGLVANEIIERSAGQPTFGRVKFQKIAFLAEGHVGISELAGSYTREAAGPLDRALIDEMESGAGSIAGIAVDQQGGTGTAVSYRLGQHRGAHRQELADWLGADRTAKLDKLIADFAPLSTKQAEAVATLYGVWNDALSEGNSPTDDEIIAGFLNNWHPEKREKFRASDLPEWLGWMRRHGIVPTGSGPKTTTGRLFV